MKLSILTYLISCTVLVVNSATFVDGLKCKSFSKKKCNTKGDGICKWKKKKCQTKCDLFKGDDTKKCEKVKGCKLKGKKCKKKPKECGDLTKKKCGKRDDCRFLDDDDDDDGFCEKSVYEYELYEGVCITGNNIEKIKDQTVDQCAALCNADSNCVGFEYGVEYGDYKYKAKDCQLSNNACYDDTECFSSSSGVFSTCCDGYKANLDFYFKLIPKPKLTRHRRGPNNHSGYDLYEGVCIKGYNIELIKDQTVDQCAARCNANLDCVGFEYGRDKGGYYDAKDCQLSDNACYDTECFLSPSNVFSTNCNGYCVNLDFYFKLSTSPTGSLTGGPTPSPSESPSEGPTARNP